MFSLERFMYVGWSRQHCTNWEFNATKKKIHIETCFPAERKYYVCVFSMEDYRATPNRPLYVLITKVTYIIKTEVFHLRGSVL